MVRKRRRRRRKAVLSVAPTFFHLLYVAVAPNPVIHFLPVGLLAAAQHRQRAARLLHHVHDAVQEIIKVLPLLCPLAICKTVVNHLLLAGSMHCCLPVPVSGVTVFIMSVSISVLVCQGHVF